MLMEKQKKKEKFAKNFFLKTRMYYTEVMSKILEGGNVREVFCGMVREWKILQLRQTFPSRFSGKEANFP